MHSRKSVSATGALLALFFTSSVFAQSPPAQPTPQPALDHVRAVSISLTGGMVIARAPDSVRWTRARVGMPIEQGASIATARNSVAEIQFENGSTVRLGELSRIDFAELAFAPNRGHVNRVTLAVGFATFHTIPQRHDEYVVRAAGADLTPQGQTEFRTDWIHGRLRVEVFHGHVQVSQANQSAKLSKNRVLACDYRTGSPVQLTGAIQTDAWDKWVRARDRQANLAAFTDPVAANGLLYGWDDLIPFGGMGQLPTDGF